MSFQTGEFNFLTWKLSILLSMNVYNPKNYLYSTLIVLPVGCERKQPSMCPFGTGFITYERLCIVYAVVRNIAPAG